MRALVLHQLNELRVEERPTPPVGPGEVRIRVVATGICGSDIHGYTGENGRRFPGQVMGHESVGRVDEVGAHVEGLTSGHVVTFNPVVLPEADLERYAGREQHSPNKVVVGVAPEVSAAFAEYVVLPARNVVPLPANVPIELGALVEPLAVAVHAVRRVLAESDRRVLVVGGGPIGQSILVALQVEGVETVYVSELDPRRRELCAELGAHVLDPDRGTPAAQLEDLGGPVDITLDAVGITATVEQSLSATRLGGQVCLVGMGAPALQLPAFEVSTKERSIVGSFTYSAQDFLRAVGLLSEDPERMAKLISRQVPVEEADGAFAALASGDGTPGKVLVRFDN